MLYFLIFLSFFVYLKASCPNGSKEWQSNCYFFQSNQSAFIVAEETCKNLGGHLVSIHDGFTNVFIAQNADLQFHESTVSDYWIGGSDLLNSGNWSWTDGSNFTFTDWNHVKNLTGEDCLSQSISDAKWSADDCFKPKQFVCAVSLTPTNPPFIDCGYEWMYYEPTGYCYGGINGLKTYNWADSETLCQQKGAHLVSIHSDAEARFINYLVRIGYRWFWIGMVSNDYEHSWSWSDGTPMDYEKWDAGRPNRNTTSCVAFAGVYVDEDCSALYYPICKMKP